MRSPAAGVAMILRTLLLILTAGVGVGLLPASAGQALELIKPSQPLAQGQVARLEVKGVQEHSGVEGRWLGMPLAFFQRSPSEYDCLVGADLQLAPGIYPLVARVVPSRGAAVTLRASLQVVSRDYGVERLRLPKEMVTLDAATLRRVRQEETRFARVWHRWSRQRYWRGAFVRPVPGHLLSVFGCRRIINGEPRSPHSGVDLRAHLGEPVQAANRGRVVLIGRFFFPGLAVVLDHGLGLYTMYFHLSRALVREGELVDKGQVVGLAGRSGRATGAHLHWGARLGEARIDPFALIRLTGG